MTITNAEAAINLLSVASSQHGDATETDHYQDGNKAYIQILEALKWLTLHHKTHLLTNLLYSPNISIRLWSASYLLLQNDLSAKRVLEEIAALKTIHGLSAETTLQEWHSGKLKSLW